MDGHSLLLLSRTITIHCTAELPITMLPPNVNVKTNISASFKYKLTKMSQPIKMVVRITLLVTFLKQLSEFYFLFFEQQRNWFALIGSHPAYVVKYPTLPVDEAVAPV
jgi:hypothetical protein